ncbi:MAG: hypothetical protein ACI92B_000953 [Marinobacter maritimus]|jgi:hypothetical protein
MSIKAQGTEVYFIDPDDGEVYKIGCVTTTNPGGSPADQLDDTCLDDNERKYKKGLRTPGQAAMSIRPDPRIDNHYRLYELSQEDDDRYIQFALGWSDGTGLVPGTGKSVEKVSVTDGGTGYTSPTVTFSAPSDPNGVTATGVVTVAGGVITGVVVTDAGSGYTAPPTVTISGTGTGATATATLSDATFVLPDARTWLTFQGYVADYPFDFATNSLVEGDMSVQRSGKMKWTRKVITP